MICLGPPCSPVDRKEFILLAFALVSSRLAAIALMFLRDSLAILSAALPDIIDKDASDALPEIID